jgi:DNA recombination protein RmuC
VTTLVLSVAFLTAAVGAAVFFALRNRRPDPAMALLQQQMDGLRALVAQQLEAVARNVTESQKTIGDRLDHSTRVVGEVQRTMAELGEASRRVFDVGQSIAGLQDLLKSPKMRGGLGEHFLGDLLGQILPAAHFSLQHAFATGAIVDAVVRLGQRLVPVDAKFPLENFRRLTEGTEEERRAARRKFGTDVKKHVDAIASKYILPDEGTYDFALMYIPAENVYYECVIKPETPGEAALLEYALAKRVIPVSPASFYAYLQAIVMGLKGLRVEENARVILASLSRLQGDVQRFSEDFDLLGRHLSNAKTKHDDASRRLEGVQDKLTAAARGEGAPALPAAPLSPQNIR